jgi:hypothetical protein
MRLAPWLAALALLVVVPFAGAYAVHHASGKPARSGGSVAAAVVERPLPAAGPAPHVRTLERAAALPAVKVRHKAKPKPKATPTPSPHVSSTPTPVVTPTYTAPPRPTVAPPSGGGGGGDGGPVGGGGSG